jgi:hypothetical protein
MDLKEKGCQEARQRESGSGSYIIRSFGVSGVEYSVSALKDLVSEMDPRETDCEDGRWIRPLE